MITLTLGDSKMTKLQMLTDEYNATCGNDDLLQQIVVLSKHQQMEPPMPAEKCYEDLLLDRIWAKYN